MLQVSASSDIKFHSTSIRYTATWIAMGKTLEDDLFFSIYNSI